ncbi:hypothetical protein [Rubricoccus marinus]|uniref:Uncharacterized protein n=1 Tax=Rubricoccus marinus TaxID=716817 RepID=A0A259U2H0_9BACT|nr:hypothetical protein [Rubricoccus marinus]OZC04253.1 hypothetical protein BSZ36_15440 [Rubricoccus marinus]
MIALLSLLLFASAPADSTESADALVRHTVAAYIAPHDPTPDPGLWQIAWGDLNADGLQDALVFAGDAEWCDANGCTLLVIEAVPAFDQEELGAYIVAAEVEMVKLPVHISGRTTEGWHDLLVRSHEGESVRLQFDGETYPFSSIDGTLEDADPSEKGATPLFVIAD